jgi:hypothetical protein
VRRGVGRNSCHFLSVAEEEATKTEMSAEAVETSAFTESDNYHSEYRMSSHRNSGCDRERERGKRRHRRLNLQDQLSSEHLRDQK